jgi:GWxTD domain-containing protein
MKRTTALPLILAVILFIGSPPNAAAQPELDRGRLMEVPNFYYDLVNVASPDSELSRLQIYVKIAYENLQFMQVEGRYQAQYEISAIIFDRDGNQVDGRTEDETVTVEQYDLTNSRVNYSTSYLKFDLPADKYKISLGLTDLETKSTRKVKDQIQLRDFRKNNLMLSDLAFVREVQVDSLGVKSFHPDIAEAIVDLRSDLYVYFEIYSRVVEDENFTIFYRIKNSKGKEIQRHLYKRSKDARRTLEYFQIPGARLSQGPYVLELKISSAEAGAEASKRFFVRWGNLPATVSDIDLAIKQLKYIAAKKELDEFKKAASDELLDKFVQFWRNHDPTPGTEANEWMDEYYQRVQFATDNFTVFRDGWKTDMGMIYIIFGPPSEVERHPFESGSKPYEIWYYHNINRYFEFMDETGFGEYRLLTRSWEAWRDLIRNY